MAATNTPATIVLDVTCEAGPELNEWLAEYVLPRGLEAEVLQERGPGGGWPEVRFSGPTTELQKFCGEFFDLSRAEFREMRKLKS